VCKADIVGLTGGSAHLRGTCPRRDPDWHVGRPDYKQGKIFQADSRELRFRIDSRFHYNYYVYHNYSALR